MTIIHASESQHWYTKDGMPAYEVKAKNGNMRPATLADARKLGLVPSVTSIINCAAKPGLERWKQEQVLHAALTLPKIEGESESDYLDRIMADSREQGKKAAERGTAIHAAIQGGYEGKPIPDEFMTHWIGAQEAVDGWIRIKADYLLDWQAEMSFALPLGFGGKCDLSCAMAIIDFKTTEKDLATIKTWDEHALQLAAYREGLGIPHARCAIVYVSVTQPGQAKVIEIPEDELRRGWLMFKALLDYWYAKTGLKRDI